MEQRRDCLAHYGVKGQKWGIRRFQNEDGSLTAEGQQRLNKLNDHLKKSDSKHTKYQQKYEKLASRHKFTDLGIAKEKRMLRRSYKYKLRSERIRSKINKLMSDYGGTKISEI